MCVFFFRDATGENCVMRDFITCSLKTDIEEWETVEWIDLARDREFGNKSYCSIKSA